ncbi:CRISPR-associated CARF protein Csx1 [Palaeococcus sp. (in: euryarchaeotes)]
MKRVIVATWGNPFQWEPIKYKYNRIELKSRNTLPITIKALNPDKVLIIAVDTVANLIVKKSNEKIKPKIELKEFNSYRDVVGDAKERIKWHITQEVIPELEKEDGELVDRISEMLKEGRIEIDIGPGVGVFGNITVEGNMLDFYHYITYDLSRWLPVDNVEVYLDLTHGINFMPTLTYRALRNLLGLLAYTRNVNFEVINFEPYPLGVREEIREKTVLNMREIGEGKVSPKPILSRVENEEWTAFISAVANGFPLVFSAFYPEIKEVGKHLGKKLQEFLEGIKIEKREDGVPRIIRTKELSKDFKNTSKLYYLLRALKGDYSKFNLKYKQEKGLTIDDIRKITDLFRGLPRIWAILDAQVEDIEKMIKGYSYLEGTHERYRKGIIDWIKERRSKNRDDAIGKLRKGTPVSLGGARSALKIFGLSGGNGDTKGEIKLRNFIAHSGFEYNVTLLKYDRIRNDILIYYKERNKVKQLACEALTYGGGKDV